MKINPEYINTDDNCVAFIPGEVTTTYGTDWTCKTLSEAFALACKTMKDIIHLAEEDIIDFNVIQSYDINKRRYYYELRLVTTMEIADKLDEVYTG